VLGAVLVLAGVVLPRVIGEFEAGPSGVKANLVDPRPRARVRLEGDQAHIEESLPSGEVVEYTETITEGSTIELWGGRVLPTSVGQDEWWVLFYAPELPEAAWVALDAASDLRWVSRASSFHTVDARVLPDDLPEPEVWRYRVIAVAQSGEQAVAKVRGVIEPYAPDANGWKFEPYPAR